MGAAASLNADATKAEAEKAGLDVDAAVAAFDAAKGENGEIKKQLAVQYKLHKALEATGSKFEIAGDAKDEAGVFNYINFTEKPTFVDNKSAMAKALTQEVWDKLKDVKSSKGYTLSNAIQTGCLLPHLGVGCTAGDEECFDLFKDLYYPVINAWHGLTVEADDFKHPTDLDFDKISFTDEQKAKFEEYVASTRIRAARNFSGFSLPCGATEEDRAGVEKTVVDALSSITDDDLKGTYYSLSDMSDEDRDALLGKGYLFQIPSDRNLLMGAGAARSWPNNRGIFHNGKGEDGNPAASGDATALAWCNEEDHCRIISMKKGGDIKDVFKRFCNLSNALSGTGAKFMTSEKLGYLGTCPSNLGTGLRASVMVKLENFNKLLEDPNSSQEDKELLETVCAKFDLQPRGSAGEHSPAVGAKFDVSNKQRLGFSEVQLVQKMIDGVAKVIALEEKLAGGATPADIRAEI